MIQSPRGSIEFIAHNSFDTQVPRNRVISVIDSYNHTQTDIENTDSSDQLVWINPTRQSLNPQILRQLANSSTLLDMAQSAKLH